MAGRRGCVGWRCVVSGHDGGDGLRVGWRGVVSGHGAVEVCACRWRTQRDSVWGGGGSCAVTTAVEVGARERARVGG
jgi:hypothetical protein